MDSDQLCEIGFFKEKYCKYQATRTLRNPNTGQSEFSQIFCLPLRWYGACMGFLLCDFTLFLSSLSSAAHLVSSFPMQS